MDASEDKPQEGASGRRAYLDVADRLRDLLNADGFLPGDRIPAEAELVRRLEVGRPLVREALVALQVIGCLEVRSGTGMFLRAPALGAGPIPSSQDLGPSLVEQLNTRLLIECQLIETAAQFITAEEIAGLDDLVATMAANHPYDDPKLGRAFHLSIARAARRTLLASILKSLLELRQGRMWSALRERLLTPEHYAQTIEDRRGIVDALRRGDRFAARNALTAMLQRIYGVYFEAEAAGTEGPLNSADSG